MALRLFIPCFFVATFSFSSSSDVAFCEEFRILIPNKADQRIDVLQIRADLEVSMEVVESVPLGFAPKGMTQYPSGDRCYVTSASQQDGTKVAHLKRSGDGAWERQSVSVVDQPMGYISTDRQGNYLMTADYVSGRLGVFAIQPDGSIGDASCRLKTPKKYAHSILTSRENKFAYVPCVKENNALYQFRFDPETGILKALDPFDARPPAVFGPRHLAFHPSLPVVYFSNEQQLGVSVYQISEGDDAGSATNEIGQLRALQHAASMPRRSPYAIGTRTLHASDLAVTTDGKWLFLAVRDFVEDEDSIFSFQIESDGRLSQTARTKVGDIPWKISLSPDEQYLVVSESFDGKLAFLSRGEGGKLAIVGRYSCEKGVRDMVVAK